MSDKITPELLLYAYASGVFPMAESAQSDEVLWIDPKRRGVLPLDRFHISKSLRKVLRSNRFRVTIDTRFEQVIRSCAAREETWINAEIFALYSKLHQMGSAHSVEVWDGQELAGGAYGIALYGAFFGESMFSAQSNGSKIALAALVMRLRIGGFSLLDTQFLTDHLASLGAVEISRAEYHRQLEHAMTIDADFAKMPELTTYSISQLSTQMS